MSNLFGTKAQRATIIEWRISAHEFIIVTNDVLRPIKQLLHTPIRIHYKVNNWGKYR